MSGKPQQFTVRHNISDPIQHQMAPKGPCSRQRLCKCLEEAFGCGRVPCVTYTLRPCSGCYGLPMFFFLLDACVVCNSALCPLVFVTCFCSWLRKGLKIVPHPPGAPYVETPRHITNHDFVSVRNSSKKKARKRDRT